MSATAARGVSAHEIAKFRALQQHWWNPTGPLRSLHMLNPVRVQYINGIVAQYGKQGGAGKRSAGLCPEHTVLDVGCGGGILSESLARLGGTVTGIDMCAESVAVAEDRRKTWGGEGAREWATRLNYEHISLFDVVAEKKALYDVVVASEVLEHVSDARGFLQALCEATKPGGLLVLSTMDKSLQTAITHIAMAEYLTGIVPVGTHDWKKFIPPGDVTKFAERFDVHCVDRQYIVSYPDVFKSVATRACQLNFFLSSSCNSGHYLWTGLKGTRTVAAQGEAKKEEGEGGAVGDSTASS